MDYMNSRLVTSNHSLVVSEQTFTLKSVMCYYAMCIHQWDELVC